MILRRGTLVLASLALSVLFVLLLLPLFAGMGTESLESAVEQFTCDSAEGRFEEALTRTYGADSEALRRWCLLEFQQYPGLPAPARQVITCRVLQEQPVEQGLLVYVELHLQGGGKRLVLQHWNQLENQWRFNPQASLRKITSAGDEG